MDSISPLAKILAEANGIDWRSIQGSGAGGSIVEQDILNYLSRVMSGDEEPPATPVDEAPPGWTGEMPPMPAAVAASGLQALSAAGVESDITDFVAQQSQSGHAHPGLVQPVQPQPIQAQPAPTQFVPTEPMPTQPMPTQPPVEAQAAPLLADAPSTTVYRPAEPVAPAFMPEVAVPAVSPIIPMQPVQAAAVETGLETSALVQHPVQVENPVQAAPVPPVPEFELGADGDSEGDLEFELDDDLPDDLPEEAGAGNAQAANSLPSGSLSAPLQPAPVVEPVAASRPAEQEFVHAVERPAFDPVAPDSEAEFLLADALPVAETVPAAVPHEAALPATAAPIPLPSQTTPPAPQSASQSQDDSQKREVIAEVAAGATGFGLGGFLSRLYGSGAAAAPGAQPAEPQGQPAVAAAPVVSEIQATPLSAAILPAVVAPVVSSPADALPVPPAAPAPAPEAAIGTAHSKPYLPSSEPAPHSASTEVAPSSPLLGEPLISQTPPIPGALLAGPLVADQWRDQPKGMEYPEHTENVGHKDAGHTEPAAAAAPHDPFMLDASSASDQELISVESDHAVPGAPSAELGQPIALPEAHEGGLEHDLPHAEPETLQAAPAAPVPVLPVPVPQNWTALIEPQPVHAERLDASASALPVSSQSGASQQPAGSQEPVGIQPADVQPLQGQPSGSQAITLRLNVDLGVLEAARAQLSEALYHEVPLSLLVARAAARSLASLGLSTSGGVALADHAGQPLAADLSADFRASLDGLGQPAQTTPALLVLDAAELGLDELHRGECSLSVGRAGGGANALSLRGDLDPVRGAKFLHEVAGLLDTPILLLF